MWGNGWLSTSEGGGGCGGYWGGQLGEGTTGRAERAAEQVVVNNRCTGKMFVKRSLSGMM